MNLRALLKKETTRYLHLVEELYYAKDSLSSEQLMMALNCSRPTLISDTQFLNMADLSFRITKTRGLYTIDFDLDATIDVVYADILRNCLEFQTIKSLFFEENDSIQTAALNLNCSFSNMQRCLQNIKLVMTVWDLSICHRPLHVTGDEAVIRRFFYLFFKESRATLTDYGFSQTLTAAMDPFLRQLLSENNLATTGNSYDYLMHHFLIGLQRQKQGHFMQNCFFKSDLIFPAESDHLIQLIKRETASTFTELHLVDCLWPLFTHQLILNEHQQLLAQQKNKSLAAFYTEHRLLLERISALLTDPLSQTEMVEILRLLGNELFAYFPTNYPLEILQETDKLLRLVDEKYKREFIQLEKIVNDFLDLKERRVLSSIYLNCLLTNIDHLLPRLVDPANPIKVLLLSDTVNQQHFWCSTFPTAIKGTVQYDYFDHSLSLSADLETLTSQYDLIITNKTMIERMATCSIIAVNTYPTAKDFEQIQQFINQFRSSPSRKERYHELTPTAQT
ncbi:helix-turn-helix domain-containing protein [Enterococcus xiangfangensis]|uniref:Helix-turn-helix domain-containing protein n=1 Tax=Enterococcus xiangfangensis TaxID=1296537 RepID=A0ABU3F8U2_9ENTE|nr:helix-turn-helix domain-containing protein [Enterococcus xiangfangensis]MDT2759092.1 helix-turn-helix domain-containing protein [Enterococcus xiangfangensis]